VEGIVRLLGTQGIDVYVDWQDPTMPENTSAKTARQIKDNIDENNFFMMLATRSACNSRWVLWEVGIADEKKAS
jgi:hypothetical protein